VIAPEYGGDGEKTAEEGLYDKPAYGFPGHWAPVGLQFYHAEQFPEKYRGGAFIAFHGSWNRAPLPQQGYNIAFLPFDGKYPSGEYEIFANGFKGAPMLLTPNQAKYRPTGLAVGPDGALYMSEDKQGRIWKVEYLGAEAAASASDARMTSHLQAQASAQASAVDFNPRGLELYNLYCLACHQVDGSGVPNLQPSLLQSERLKNDDAHILRLILQGSAWIEKPPIPEYHDQFFLPFQ
jgi:mono/diheme cytochrome c family protein